MQKIHLLTKDASFIRELAAILPKGYGVVTNPPASGNAIVFFDIDTMRPGIIRELSEKNLVLAVTGQKKTGPVMEAATFGAYEALRRPLGKEAVSLILRELNDLGEEIRHAVAVAPSSPAPTCAIVGYSPAIMNMCKKLGRLSQVDAPVLITGETGTGKELVAESIAQLSVRFGKPFVVINCAAVPETLLESELFGFEKGSFTGAAAPKEGMLKIADEGCDFFDEIGELPLSLQGKLLRFLQTQTFYPLGSTKEVQVNVRVISATNRDLSAMVREGKFREDLYHRLRVTGIHIPPLRERREDIPSLVQFFVNRYRHTATRPVKGVTKAFLKKMLSYEWPGNIRELENTIRSAIATAKTAYLTTRELNELGELTLPLAGSASAGSFAPLVIPFLKEALRKKEKSIYEKIHQEVDRPMLDYILSYTRENQSEAARILGINRLTLRKKLKF
ncbi:MAG: sigma-54-dependent Fis family transcriptional regulator [Nitrospirae bacterium]|nr:sigma-54-dependent Fis family transcriptional regulator [Nitrospirota bacterium]